jgi:hypothetical protein
MRPLDLSAETEEVFRKFLEAGETGTAADRNAPVSLLLSLRTDALWRQGAILMLSRLGNLDAAFVLADAYARDPRTTLASYYFDPGFLRSPGASPIGSSSPMATARPCSAAGPADIGEPRQRDLQLRPVSVVDRQPGPLWPGVRTDIASCAGPLCRAECESRPLLYSRLLAECGRSGGSSSRGISFVSKTLRKQKHWYLQLVVGPAKTQHYLGPDSEELRAHIAEQKALWRRGEPDRQSREKLVAMLLAGDAASIGASEARIFQLLERAGVFLVGGTLVSSHAFGVYANMLGVRWESETTRTLDVDIAADSRLQIGVPDTRIDLRALLLESGMGFFEVPALNRKHPSTRYSMRGQRLTVDLLTPMRGKPASKPVLIQAPGAVAERVRFLDYLLEATEPAVLVANAGVLVNVPTPARYALDKLVILERRSAAMQTKALKDLSQAQQLIEVLARDRPGDLQLAWEAALTQPAKFRRQLLQGAKRLPEDQQQALRGVM